MMNPKTLALGIDSGVWFFGQSVFIYNWVYEALSHKWWDKWASDSKEEVLHRIQATKM